MPAGQSALSVPIHKTLPCPCLSFAFPGRGRHIPAPVGGASGPFLSVVCSFSSLLCRFSVLVSRELSGSMACAVATSAIRGLAGVVEPHLLAAVRFLPTREGGRRPKNRATFQVSPSVCGTQLGIAVLIYWWDVLGLRFLTLPAVTSASEILTQTYRSSGVVQLLACWAHNPKVRKEQRFMIVCGIVLQSRTWTCPFPESGGF